MLDALDIPYEIDSNMVRGLDYYTHTIFEIMSEAPKWGRKLRSVRVDAMTIWSKN